MKRRATFQSRREENRVWQLLLSRRREWTPTRELSEISSHYRYIINSLGRRGVSIESKVGTEGRVKHTHYRLTALPLIGKKVSTPKQLNLFSPMELERTARWVDPGESAR
jgi:hypothetical protein